MNYFDLFELLFTFTAGATYCSINFPTNCMQTKEVSQESVYITALQLVKASSPNYSEEPKKTRLKVRMTACGSNSPYVLHSLLLTSVRLKLRMACNSESRSQ